MPTYEYACNDCGKHLEVVQSFKDDSLTECPSCQGRLRKVFGSIGVSFKGSGFYKTDSRKASTSGSTSAGSKSGDTPQTTPAASESTGSSSAGTDSGTASKPAAPAPAASPATSEKAS